MSEAAMAWAIQQVRNPDLGYQRRMVLLALAMDANEGGAGMVSRRELAAAAMVRRRRVLAVVDELARLELVQAADVWRHRRTRRVWLTYWLKLPPEAQGPA